MLEEIRKKYMSRGNNSDGGIPTHICLAKQYNADLDSTDLRVPKRIDECLYEDAIERQQRLLSKRLAVDIAERNRCGKLNLVARRQSKCVGNGSTDAGGSGASALPSTDPADPVYIRLYNCRKDREVGKDATDAHPSSPASSAEKTTSPKKKRNGEDAPPIPKVEDLEKSTLVETNSKLIESFSYLWRNNTQHHRQKGEEVGTGEMIKTTISDSSPHQVEVSCTSSTMHESNFVGSSSTSSPRPRSVDHLLHIQKQLNQDDRPRQMVMNSSARYASHIDKAVKRKYNHLLL